MILETTVVDAGEENTFVAVSTMFEDEIPDGELWSEIILKSNLTHEDPLPGPIEPAKRKKRDTTDKIGNELPEGCEYVFGDGKKDMRDTESLSIRREFFLLNPHLLFFDINFNVTKVAEDHRGEMVTTYGFSSMRVDINQPPENGTCLFSKMDENGVYQTKDEFGVMITDGRALIDQYNVICTGWVDPEKHKIVKYSVTAVRTIGQPERFPLYSGDKNDMALILPVGYWTVKVEIEDELGSAASYYAAINFRAYPPTYEEYQLFNLIGLIEQLKAIGDSSTLAQVIKADSSVRQEACYFDVECAFSGGPNAIPLGFAGLNMTEEEKEMEIFSLILAISEANKLNLDSLLSLPLSTMDQLGQSSATLYGIVKQAAGNGTYDPLTLDMEGRATAIEAMKRMSAAFVDLIQQEPILDPNGITGVVEDITGSAMSMIGNLHKVLSAKNLEDLPPRDQENADGMSYDTSIGTGEDGNIADPDEAKRKNVLALSKFYAKQQLEEMLSLVEEITKNVAMAAVPGEEFRTSAPGVKIIMGKVSYSDTIGTDTTGDLYPEHPMRYEFEDSQTVVEFPLGFCPGDRTDPSSPSINFQCRGKWGIVIKEWEAVTRMYMWSYKNVNEVSYQVDATFYDGNGNIVDISGMVEPIKIIIERHKHKNPAAVSFTEDMRPEVNVKARLKDLKARDRPYIIYHAFNISIYESALGVQFQSKEESYNTSLIVILARRHKMPTLNTCDFIWPVRNFEQQEGDFLDMFISREEMNNRTGTWYAGVLAVNDEATLAKVMGKRDCNAGGTGLAKSDLKQDFGSENYIFQTYTAACYFLNPKDVWESSGTSVLNTTNVITGCSTNHLTSFASGFFPESNTIDFEFIFANSSFVDNLTINFFVILCFTLYIIGMIYALIMDRKDLKKINSPFMKDNHPDDNYMYELLVETGPLMEHSNTSKVEFILTGEDDSTDIRCLNDPDRELFGKGNTDAFLMTTEFPIG